MKGNRIGVGYICGDCADLACGKWPKGHIATFHMGICDSCGEEKGLCHTSDYDWPYQPELEENREI